MKNVKFHRMKSMGKCVATLIIMVMSVGMLFSEEASTLNGGSDTALSVPIPRCFPIDFPEEPDPIVPQSSVVEIAPGTSHSFNSADGGFLYSEETPWDIEIIPGTDGLCYEYTDFSLESGKVGVMAKAQVKGGINFWCNAAAGVFNEFKVGGVPGTVVEADCSTLVHINGSVYRIGPLMETGYAHAVVDFYLRDITDDIRIQTTLYEEEIRDNIALEEGHEIDNEETLTGGHIHANLICGHTYSLCLRLFTEADCWVGGIGEQEADFATKGSEFKGEGVFRKALNVTIQPAALSQSDIDGIEDKIDDLSDAVSTLDGKVDTLTDKVDALDGKAGAIEAKIDTLNTKADEMDAKLVQLQLDMDEMMEREIEEMLYNQSELVSLYLPESFSGRLELVWDVVSNLISASETAGLDVSQSLKFYNSAVEKYNAGEYHSSFKDFSASYRMLIVKSKEK